MSIKISENVVEDAYFPLSSFPLFTKLRQTLTGQQKTDSEISRTLNLKMSLFFSLKNEDKFETEITGPLYYFLNDCKNLKLKMILHSLSDMRIQKIHLTSENCI